MNAGTEFGQLAACFVIPVEDGIEEIFDAIKTTALIQKTGVGYKGSIFSKTAPWFSSLRAHVRTLNRYETF